MRSKTLFVVVGVLCLAAIDKKRSVRGMKTYDAVIEEEIKIKQERLETCRDEGEDCDKETSNCCYGLKCVVPENAIRKVCLVDNGN